MQAILKSVSKPRWSNADQTTIDCEITTSQFGDEVLPFTASPNDVEPHGRRIFFDIVAGNYGPIAEFAPYIPTQEENAAEIRAQRNAILEASDWTQAADVPQATKDKWAPYRQALRHVPQQTGFPNDVDWPEKPV
jgi:hypothetical protein